MTNSNRTIGISKVILQYKILGGILLLVLMFWPKV